MAASMTVSVLMPMLDSTSVLTGIHIYLRYCFTVAGVYKIVICKQLRLRFAHTCAEFWIEYVVQYFESTVDLLFSVPRVFKFATEKLD